MSRARRRHSKRPTLDAANVAVLERAKREIPRPESPHRRGRPEPGRPCRMCDSTKARLLDPEELRAGIAGWVRRDPWVCRRCERHVARGLS